MVLHSYKKCIVVKVRTKYDVSYVETGYFSTMELLSQGELKFYFFKCFDSQKLKNIHKDINGCFIIITLDIDSVPIVLCNLYAPNIDKLDFFETLTMHICVRAQSISQHVDAGQLNILP